MLPIIIISSQWRGGKRICANARDAGSIPGLGRSPGGGTGNPFIPACKVPRTEEPGGPQSMES